MAPRPSIFTSSLRLDAAPLPAFTAGAHIDVHLPDGVVRQYSLCNPQGERHRYVVGVKRDLNSRGGSRYMHDQLRVGTVLQVGEPRNNFPLHEEASSSMFIAGGIGVTPIACMVDRLRQLGRPWRPALQRAPARGGGVPGATGGRQPAAACRCRER